MKFSWNHVPHLNLCKLLNPIQSLVYVSNTSKGSCSLTLFVLPPMTNIRDPTKMLECWYLDMGVDFSGALTQSQCPFLCLRRPQLSPRGLLSSPRPPKTTIMPAAVPDWHKAAEWYTLGEGASPSHLTSCQTRGGFWIFKIQQSLTDFSPMLPPNTIRYGLV